jgi:signal transduction histidine kinase
MHSQPDNGNMTLLKLSSTGGLISAILGFSAIVGWIFKFPGLSTFGNAFIPMAPSTAILFLVFGLAVFMNEEIRSNRYYRIAANIIIALGTLLAAALFASSSRGVFLAVESLGMTIDAVSLDVPVGHMSPITAILFIFSGFSLLMGIHGSINNKRIQTGGLLLTLPVFLTGSFLLLAYLLGSPAFYGTVTIPPALPTSLAFFMMGGSLMAYFAKNIWFKTIARATNEIRPVIILFLLFLLLASGIVLVGYHNHREYASQFRAEAEKMLDAIGGFKTGELSHWRKERLDDANLFYRNPYLSRLIKSLLENPEDTQTRVALEEMLKFMQTSRNYDLFGIYDTRGNELMAYPTGAETISLPVIEQLSGIADSGEVGFLDFYLHDHQDIYLAMVVPVFDPQDPGATLATLIIRIDPDHYLYPMISQWPGSGESGETLIVRREGDEVVFLNELRFLSGAALSLRFRIDEKPDNPAAMAVRGQTGIVEGVDYRGNPVFASLHHVPDSPWFLITRMDAAEVYQTLGQHLRNSILLILLLIGLTGFGVFLGWRQQQLKFLREKVLAIEASDRLKTAFMNNISHELRTPLNSILGFGQVMAQPGLSDAHRNEFLVMVQRSSDRLLATINNYMDISLVTSGNLEFHPKKYGVKAMLNELYQEFQPRCISKGLELKMETAALDKVFHFSDSELLKKAMNLLLDNAVKFTRKGIVTFGHRNGAADAVNYYVSDTGIGVSAENIRHLYTPYWQEESGPTSHYEGSGLGLPIAKGIVDKLGGIITVETEKGKGSTFVITVPGEVSIQKTIDSQAPEEVMANGRKPLVLIAEDDENNAQYYAFALEKAACELLFATNGKEAVDIVKKTPHIRLVLMDLKMPVMNGFDATRQIKMMRSDLPVVATTAYAMTHDEKRARDAGCDDYLTKPIRPGTLSLTLEKYGVIPRQPLNGFN